MANTVVSLVLDMASRHLPSGVELSLTEPDEQLSEFRYVPDAELKALHEQLEELEGVEV